MSTSGPYLVADIGGTNTRVALAHGAALITDSVKRYRNAEHPGLETVLRHYLEETGTAGCAGACVALAGPVQNGRGTLTNLDWTLDEATLARAAHTGHATLLNDLQAQGHALDQLPDGSVTTLITAAKPQTGTAKLVIGIGTGFNIAPVYSAPTGRVIPAAEAGHATLPARTDVQKKLVADFEAKHGFCAIEDMLSGRGVLELYKWLRGENGLDADKSSFDIIGGIEDDPDCKRTAQLFVDLLGNVAGNLALTQLPFGGIYFAGGVARALSQHFTALGFSDAFRDKGRFAAFMDSFSVHVIEDDYAALTGCACYLDASVGRVGSNP